MMRKVKNGIVVALFALAGFGVPGCILSQGEVPGRGDTAVKEMKKSAPTGDRTTDDQIALIEAQAKIDQATAIMSSRNDCAPPVGDNEAMCMPQAEKPWKDAVADLGKMDKTRFNAEERKIWDMKMDSAKKGLVGAQALEMRRLALQMSKIRVAAAMRIKQLKEAVGRHQYDISMETTRQDWMRADEAYNKAFRDLKAKLPPGSPFLQTAP